MAFNHKSQMVLPNGDDNGALGPALTERVASVNGISQFQRTGNGSIVANAPEPEAQSESESSEDETILRIAMGKGRRRYYRRLNRLIADRPEEESTASPDADMNIRETRTPGTSVDRNGNNSQEQLTESSGGKYYLDVVNKEQERLEALVAKANEQLLLVDDTSEEAGKIRAVIGKCTLLYTKKFKQFRELCNTNLEQSRDGTVAEDRFGVVKAADLAGFWTIVTIQLEQINKMFADLEYNRGQIEGRPASPGASKENIPAQKKKISKIPARPKHVPKPETAAKEEERRKMFAEKRRAMKAAMEEKAAAAADLVVAAPDTVADTEAQNVLNGNAQFFER